MQQKQNPKIKSLLNTCYIKQYQNLHLNNKQNEWLEIINYCQCTNNIRILSLWFCNICEMNVGKLGRVEWGALVCLDLSINLLTDKSIKTLLKNPWPKLQQLLLTQNQIKKDGLQQILHKLSSQLKILDLSQNLIIGADLILFIQYPILKLTELRLDKNYLGLIGVKLLTKINFPQLQLLNINNCGITRQGMKYISKGRWHKLTKLMIVSQKDGGQLIEFEQNNWINLKHLQIRFMSNIVSLSLLTMKNQVKINLFPKQWSKLRQKLYGVMNTRLQVMN